MRWPLKKTEPATWRSWFAWYPVLVGEEVVWLEWVVRKGEKFGACNGDYITEWKYRLNFP